MCETVRVCEVFTDLIFAGIHRGICLLVGVFHKLELAWHMEIPMIVLEMDNDQVVKLVKCEAGFSGMHLGLFAHI